MDPADLADKPQEDLIGEAIDQARREIGPNQIQRCRCIDCDEPIPGDRIKAMKQNNMACERCVACQTAHERRS